MMTEADPSPDISTILSQIAEYLNISGDTVLPIILAAAHGDGTSPNLPVLNYLLQKEDISRIDKIAAMEMAGAVLLGHDDNHELSPLAFQYWRRALALRLLNFDCCRPIPKEPTKSKNGQLSEWNTLDDIERIEMQDPVERFIQSILVRLKISSSLCWDAFYRCYMYSFMDVLYFFERKCSLSQLLDLSRTTLDTILHRSGYDPLDHPWEDSILTIRDMLISRFEILQEEGDPDLNPENVHKLVEIFSVKPGPSYPGELVKQSYWMFTVFSGNLELVTEEIRLSLIELIRDGNKEDSFSILVHVILSARYRAPHSVIRFLVKLGANPNPRIYYSHPWLREQGAGILHYLAYQVVETGDPTDKAKRDETACLLLELGAHLDMVDGAGNTPVDWWLEENKDKKKEDLPDWLKEGVPKLMCLSSRVICRHKLPYDDGAILPVTLIPFVALHCSDF